MVGFHHAVSSLTRKDPALEYNLRGLLGSATVRRLRGHRAGPHPLGGQRGGSRAGAPDFLTRLRPLRLTQAPSPGAAPHWGRGRWGGERLAEAPAQVETGPCHQEHGCGGVHPLLWRFHPHSKPVLRETEAQHSAQAKQREQDWSSRWFRCEYQALGPGLREWLRRKLKSLPSQDVGVDLCVGSRDGGWPGLWGGPGRSSPQGWRGRH